MLHSSIHSPVALCAQIRCTWSRLWKWYMVDHGILPEGTGQGNISKWGYMNEKFVTRSICSTLAAERPAMWKLYLIHQSQNMCSSGSEIEILQIFCMQFSIHTNNMLAVNNDYMIMCINLLTIQQQLGHVSGERQRSVDNFKSFKQRNWKMMCLMLCMNNLLVVFIGKSQSDMVPAPYWESVST